MPCSYQSLKAREFMVLTSPRWEIPSRVMMQSGCPLITPPLTSTVISHSASWLPSLWYTSQPSSRSQPTTTFSRTVPTSKMRKVSLVKSSSIPPTEEYQMLRIQGCPIFDALTTYISQPPSISPVPRQGCTAHSPRLSFVPRPPCLRTLALISHGFLAQVIKGLLQALPLGVTPTRHVRRLKDTHHHLNSHLPLATCLSWL